jgi:type VI protein secretion system component VasK
MMMDLVWDVATSFWALSALALIFAAAFIVAHVPNLALRFWPAAYAYVKAAALVQVIAASLFCFLVGFRVSDERAEAKSLRLQLAAQQIDITAANDAADKKDAALTELAQQAEQAQERIEDYEERLRRRAPAANGANCGCTLVPDDFDSVPNNRRSAP